MSEIILQVIRKVKNFSIPRNTRDPYISIWDNSLGHPLEAREWSIFQQIDVCEFYSFYARKL